jgi:hypothetical protein
MLKKRIVKRATIRKRTGTFAKRGDKNLFWTSQWDGKPQASMKVHQLVKKGKIVAYIKQENPKINYGSEYAYVRGNFRPVFATTKGSSVPTIKKGLEKWAKGKGQVRVIEDD